MASVPPTAVTSDRLKETGASLNVKLIVELGLARLTVWPSALPLLSLTVTVGILVSTVKAAVEPPEPGLPLFSDQLPEVTLTAALPMSVLALPVNVAE